MIIRAYGTRKPDHISANSTSETEVTSLDFRPDNPHYVGGIRVNAGIIPDLPNRIEGCDCGYSLAGVFEDEMPQTVITHAYNHHLDYIMLYGAENPVYIENLKRTLRPDILPDVRVIKAITIREADDVKRWRPYGTCADLLLFRMECDRSALIHYDGDAPFLLNVGTDEAATFNHPRCAGVCIEET